MNSTTDLLMRRRGRRGSAGALAVACWLAAAWTAPGQTLTLEPIPLDPEVFRSEDFRRRLAADFAPRADVEPKLTPEEGELMAELAPLLESNPREALERFRQALQPGSSASLHFIVAHLLRTEGDAAGAEAEYRQAVQKFPRFLRAVKHLGVMLAQQGKFAEAQPFLLQAVELGENSSDVYGLLAQCYKEAGSLLAAEAAYRQAYLLEPGSAIWKLNLVDTLARTGKWAEANAMLEAMIAESPSNPSFWLLQANCYLGMEKFFQAAANLEVVRRMGSADRQVLERLGRIYLANGKPSAALSAYSAALDSGQAIDAEAALSVARLLFQQGAYNEAESYLERLRARAGGRLERREELELDTLRARIAAIEERTDDAVEILEKVVLESVNGEARIELGRLYGKKAQEAAGEDEKLRFLASAEHHFEVAGKIPGSEAEAFLRHGQALVKNLEFERAVPLLERSLELQPNDKVKEYFVRVERAAQRQARERQRLEERPKNAGGGSSPGGSH